MAEKLIRLGLGNQDELGDDEPDYIIDPSATADLAAFSAQLLALVSDTCVESDTLRTYEFRAKLEKYRHRLSNSVQGDPQASLIACDCLRICEDYLTRARTYLLDRETELAEVIDVMRLALNKLAGEANAFNVRLMGSSERFNRLTEIEDIRELKRRISDEVRDLNRAVVDKQKQDEQNYTSLNKRIEVLQTNLNQAKETAQLDSLTNIPNRGAFDVALKKWVASNAENRKPFVLVLLDLDDFKEINDTRGHQVGDRVLFCAAQWFQKSVRGSDFLARYGGEEFVILLSDLDLSKAEAKFTELLSKMAACNYEYDIGLERHVLTFTASCGLAEFSLEESAEDLLRRADEALYQAKRAGKNRVVALKKQKSLWKALKPFGRG
jgi:diguanylate cyclase (GGDEF)-like protein